MATKTDRHLAHRINDYWAARGVNAGAKAGSRIGKTRGGATFAFASIVSDLTGYEAP